MELPIFEELLIYLSHILSLGLVIYVWLHVNKKLALMFFVSFVLIYQQYYLLDFITSIDERTEETGKCWAEKQDFYACMSIYERISIHAAQIGSVLVIISTIFLAKKGANKDDL